jgi:hypothetical protein
MKTLKKAMNAKKKIMIAMKKIVKKKLMKKNAQLILILTYGNAF